MDPMEATGDRHVTPYECADKIAPFRAVRGTRWIRVV